jgi:hypothetical protein
MLGPTLTEWSDMVNQNASKNYSLFFRKVVIFFGLGEMARRQMVWRGSIIMTK